ncbi:MAG TPA: response regulator [Terriglobia bacterium]|nr:response regulator [Terriglobia bacterium]
MDVDDKRVRIVFLDDSEDLREAMRVLLETALGVECMCFGSLMELEERSNEALDARMAILDINLGPGVPSGLDAFRWLNDQGFRGKVLFFTGHARTNPDVRLALERGAQVLEKPLQPDRLIALLTRALDEAS